MGRSFSTIAPKKALTLVRRTGAPPSATEGKRERLCHDAFEVERRRPCRFHSTYTMSATTATPMSTSHGHTAPRPCAAAWAMTALGSLVVVVLFTG